MPPREAALQPWWEADWSAGAGRHCTHARTHPMHACMHVHTHTHLMLHSTSIRGRPRSCRGINSKRAMRPVPSRTARACGQGAGLLCLCMGGGVGSRRGRRREGLRGCEATLTTHPRPTWARADHGQGNGHALSLGLDGIQPPQIHSHRLGPLPPVGGPARRVGVGVGHACMTVWAGWSERASIQQPTRPSTDPPTHPPTRPPTPPVCLQHSSSRLGATVKRRGGGHTVWIQSMNVASGGEHACGQRRWGRKKIGRGDVLAQRSPLAAAAAAAAASRAVSCALLPSAPPPPLRHPSQRRPRPPGGRAHPRRPAAGPPRPLAGCTPPSTPSARR